eukprot:COSAG01_NODE_247_length_20443_cov_52.339543_21_plen_87_part_00
MRVGERPYAEYKDPKSASPWLQQTRTHRNEFALYHIFLYDHNLTFTLHTLIPTPLETSSTTVRHAGGTRLDSRTGNSSTGTSYQQH